MNFSLLFDWVSELQMDFDFSMLAVAVPPECGWD